MIKRASCLVTGLALVAAAAVPASAATTPKKHSLSGTAQVVTISSQGTPPNVTSTGAGVVKGPIGSGAIVANTTFSGTSFTNKFRVFLLHGTFKGTLSGTFTTNADGSISSSGTAKITGGTGAYRGATGKLTFNGKTPANSNVSTFQVKGSAKY